MKEKSTLKDSIVSFLEVVWYVLSFSFDITFRGKILKLFWIGLAVSTYSLFGLKCAILFVIAFASIMISSIFIVGIAYVFSRNRD